MAKNWIDVRRQFAGIAMGALIGASKRSQLTMWDSLEVIDNRDIAKLAELSYAIAEAMVSVDDRFYRKDMFGEGEEDGNH